METLTRRNFACEADKYEMAALARRNASESLHVIDLPYRLSSWALDDARNASLWLNGQQELAGWAVLQTPFWTLDYVLSPQAGSQLLEEMLAWADQRAEEMQHTEYGHPAWFAMVFARQAERIAALQKAGYQCQADKGEDSWSKVLMRRSSAEPVKRYPAPVGFKVRSLAGDAEVEDYTALHQAVFESKNMTADWRGRTIHHADYRPDLDLVVESPEGRLASFCVCWAGRTAHGELVGHVEPLGCHKDFRQYALGRVALAEGLHRLQGLGIQNIYVETDSYRNTAFRLYESFDFQVIEDVLVFARELPKE